MAEPVIDTATLSSLLDEHRWRQGRPSTGRCVCGVPVEWIGDAGADIRAHRAEMLLPLLAEERAEAWDACVTHLTPVLGGISKGLALSDNPYRTEAPRG